MSPMRESQAMRALVQDRYGTAEVLELRIVHRPQIASTQVLIEVHAAGVDRGVAHLVTGTAYLIRLAGYGIIKPKHSVAGADVAGRVVAVGDDVTRFRVGDEVFGIANGAYAEYAAAEEQRLVHKPANITFQQAGVAAISGGTALQARTDVGRLEAGQRVLVVGASGGVGSCTVQLAKALGGVITGVASTAKVDMVRSIGADHVVDYSTQDFLDGIRRYDLIIDIGGRNSIRRLRRALTPAGTLVLTGGEGGGRWTGGFLERQLRAAGAVAPRRAAPQGLRQQGAPHDPRTPHRPPRHRRGRAGHRSNRRPRTRFDAIRDLAAGRIAGKAAVVVRSP